LVGKRATLFWESRAYKGGTNEGEDEEEEQAQTIIPVRSFDEVTAYQETLARIDRLEGPQEPQGLKQEVQSEKTEQLEEVESKNTLNTTTGKEDESDPLGSEFSTPSQMLNLIHRMSHEANEPDEQTNH
jgi:hypothetical protein